MDKALQAKSLEEIKGIKQERTQLRDQLSSTGETQFKNLQTAIIDKNLKQAYQAIQQLNLSLNKINKKNLSPKQKESYIFLANTQAQLQKFQKNILTKQQEEEAKKVKKSTNNLWNKMANMINKNPLYSIISGTVLYRWLQKGGQWLFQSKKKRKAKKKKENKKGWREYAKSRFKKGLTVAVGRLGFHWWRENREGKKANGEINSGTSGSTLSENNKTEARDFLAKIPVEEQERALDASDAINTLLTTDPDFFGEAGYEETDLGNKTPGLLLAMLQKRHHTVKETTSGYTYYKELIGAKTNDIRQKVKKRPIDQIKDFGYTLLSEKQMAQISKITDKNSLIRLLTKSVSTEHINHFLRKVLDIISYLQIKKRQLPEAVANTFLAKKYEKKTDNKKAWSDRDIDEKEDAIDDLLENEVRYTKYVQTALEQYDNAPIINISNNKTASALQILEQYNILDDSTDDATQKILNKETKFRKETINRKRDEETKEISTCFSEWEIQIDKSQMEDEDYQEVSEMIDSVIEHGETTGEQNFLTSYLPIISFFNNKDATKAELLPGYKNLFKEYRDPLIKLQKKANNKTLDKEDIHAIRGYSKDYFQLQKRLTLQVRQITDIKETNGGMSIMFGNIMNTGKNTLDAGKSGLEKIGNGLNIVISKEERDSVSGIRHKGTGIGDIMKGATQLTGTVISVEAFFRLPRAVYKGLLWKNPGLPRVIKRPLKTLARGGKKTLKKIPNTRISSYYYGAVGKKQFIYDFMHGQIKPSKAGKIATKRKWIDANINGKKTNIRDFVMNTSISPEHQKILNTYRDSPNIRRQLMIKDRIPIKGGFIKKGINRGKFWKKRNPNAVEFSIESKVLETLKKLNNLKQGRSDILKTFIDTGTKSSKDINKRITLLPTEDHERQAIEDILGTLGRKEQKSIAKMLSKKAPRLLKNKIGMKQRYEFYKTAKSQGNITNKVNFLKNSLKNRRKIKTSTGNINYVKLNTNRTTKALETIRKAFDKSIQNIQNVLDNPRLNKVRKVHLGEQLSRMKDLKSTIKSFSPDTLQGLKASIHLKINFSSLQHTGDITKMIKMMDDHTTFRKLLRNAKTTEEIKDILKTYNIILDNQVMNQLAKTKNVRHMYDILSYSKNYEKIGKFMKIIKHPAMRMIGRNLGHVLVGLDVYSAIIDYNTLGKEHQQAKNDNNIALTEIIEQEKLVKTFEHSAIIGAGGFGAGTLFLTTIGAMQSVPIAGQIASAIVTVGYGLYEITNIHFKVLKRYQNNETSFRRMRPHFLQQQIISALESNYSDASTTDRGRYDGFANIFGNQDDKLGKKIKENFVPAALKAWLYQDEMSTRYPLAGFNLEDITSAHQPFEDLKGEDHRKEREKLFNTVKKQKDAINIAVQQRFARLEEHTNGNWGDIIASKKREKNKGLEELNYLLRRSLRGSIGTSVLDHIESDSRFSAIQTFAQQYPYEASQYLLLAYEYRIEYPKLQDNIDYFIQAIQSISLSSKKELPRVQYDKLPPLAERDDQAIYNFFETFSYTSTPSPLPISQKESNTLTLYHMSGNLGQDIIYRICREVLDYKGPNIWHENNDEGNPGGMQGFLMERTISANVTSSETTGIYINGDKICVTNDPGFDHTICDIVSINKPKNITTLKNAINEEAPARPGKKRLIDTPNNKADTMLSNEIATHMTRIIDEEQDIYNHPEKIQGEINKYVLQYAPSGEYIQLPVSLAIKAYKTHPKLTRKEPTRWKRDSTKNQAVCLSKPS